MPFHSKASRGLFLILFIEFLSGGAYASNSAAIIRTANDWIQRNIARHPLLTTLGGEGCRVLIDLRPSRPDSNGADLSVVAEKFDEDSFRVLRGNFAATADDDCTISPVTALGFGLICTHVECETQGCTSITSEINVHTSGSPGDDMLFVVGRAQNATRCDVRTTDGGNG
jgi:hypothetical protein